MGASLVRTADDVATFLDWLNKVITEERVIAVDTEATGLAWWSPQFLRLVQFGNLTEGWAIPVNWWGKVIEEAMARLVAAKTRVVFHNAKFDMHALESEGYPIPSWDQVEDTAVLMHLRRSDLSRALKGKHAAELLGPWVYQAKDNLKQVAKDKYGLKGSDVWAHIPVDEPALWVYGVMDTILTRMIYEKLCEECVPFDFGAQVQREMHYQAIMYRAEKRGIRVDEGYTLHLQETLDRDIKRDLVFLQSSGLANPNSNDQVIALLEEDFGFMPWEFTETGRPSVNKNVLAVLASAGGMQADVVEALVRYKRNVKWRSTYVDTFLSASDVHGFVHPSINTMAARTGRSSIQGPPLQTLPSGDPMIRRCLLPPKGHLWYSLDYSNQEPRSLAHYGRSPQLLRYFTEGDGTGSIHDFVAEQMFGAGYSKEQRSLAKIFGLSRSYGAGPEKMAQASGLPVAQVERLLPAYDDLVGLRSLNDMIAQVAAERAPQPFIVTSGGRRSYSDPDKEYTLVNFLMQGSGADMLKDAAIRLDAEDLSDFILVPVHDEMTFGFPKDEGDAMAARARELMQTDEFLVPMPVDIDGPGKSWGHLYGAS